MFITLPDHYSQRSFTCQKSQNVHIYCPLNNIYWHLARLRITLNKCSPPWSCRAIEFFFSNLNAGKQEITKTKTRNYENEKAIVRIRKRENTKTKTRKHDDENTKVRWRRCENTWRKLDHYRLESTFVFSSSYFRDFMLLHFRDGTNGTPYMCGDRMSVYTSFPFYTRNLLTII